MMEFLNGLTFENIIHSIDETPVIINEVKKNAPLIRVNRSLSYYNIPLSFDIETTSFFQQLESESEPLKQAIMYVWTASINGRVIMGRTWKDFIRFVAYLVKGFELDFGHRVIIYVHNLQFDFAFFRKWLEWSKVFCLDSRKPVYAITTDGVEFRCSYILSGYKLSNLANQLRIVKIKKLIGDLDYKLVRHSKTELTETEKQYCVNDVQIIIAYIYERIIVDGDISKIPLTKTGYVRQYIRNNCFYPNGVACRDSAKELAYKRLIHRMNLSGAEYGQLKNAFQGGFTHANPFYVGKTIDNVSSYDFTSSYPAVIVSEKFPMTASELLKEVTRDAFEFSINNYCCLFEVEFENICAIIYYDNYISRYRCRELINVQCNNGRVVRADHLKTTITEQDFFIIRKFYKWDKMRVGNFRRYKRGYLPTNFIKSVLKLYQDKTKLKGVDGKEVEYMQSKEMINSCYGMMVTDIVRDEITYVNNMWETEPGRANEEKPEKDIEKEIAKYNKNNNRFLFYPWGVWVTAYARRNLFTAITEFGKDYIYSDTDSVKVINAGNHKKYIEEYNLFIRMKLLKALEFHKIPFEMIEPCTVKGVKKQLGAWDYEGCYTRFKTLGAKRYIVEKDGKINITVSGLNKSVCVPYIESRGIDAFNFFDNRMSIPAAYTGKQTHTYIDTPMKGGIVDYMGALGEYYERSGIHLSESPYDLSMSGEFVEYLNYIRGVNLNGY